jgi:hypothetical protein
MGSVVARTQLGVRLALWSWVVFVLLFLMTVTGPATLIFYLLVGAVLPLLAIAFVLAVDSLLLGVAGFFDSEAQPFAARACMLGLTSALALAWFVTSTRLF